MQDLHIEVRDQGIVVTMLGTNLRVVYLSLWRHHFTAPI